MHAEPGRARRARQGRDRGATLTEYALIFSLLIVGVAGSVQYLSNQASEQINNNAECVSMRPPPASCQTPAQPVPPNYNSFPPTTLNVPPAPTGSATFQTVVWNSGPKTITGAVHLVSGGSPVGDAVVYVKWSCNGGTFYTTTTSNASGDATLSLGNCSGPGGAIVTVYRIDSSATVPVPIETTVTLT